MSVGPVVEPGSNRRHPLTLVVVRPGPRMSDRRPSLGPEWSSRIWLVWGMKCGLSSLTGFQRWGGRSSCTSTCFESLSGTPKSVVFLSPQVLPPVVLNTLSSPALGGVGVHALPTTTRTWTRRSLTVTVLGGVGAEGLRLLFYTVGPQTRLVPDLSLPRPPRVYLLTVASVSPVADTSSPTPLRARPTSRPPTPVLVRGEREGHSLT